MKAVALLFVLLIPAVNYGQEVNLELGRISTSFRYINSDKEVFKLKDEVNGSFGIGFRNPFESSYNKLFFAAGATIHKYSAQSSEEDFGEPLTWEFHMLGLNVGLEYVLIDKTKWRIGRADDDLGFTTLIKGSLSPEFFLSGEQFRGEEFYSLKGAPEFDDVKLIGRIGVKFNYKIQDFNFYLQYLYGRNFANILTGPYNEERLYIDSQVVNIGLSVMITEARKLR